MSSPADQPRVELITPVYNGARYLTECMESVIRQTYSNWRFTVIDNCSTDETVRIANSYAERDERIRVVTSDSFLPVIENHNRSIGHVTSAARFVKPLMADDWLFPQCIERMVDCALANPSIGLVCSLALGRRMVLFQGLRHPATFIKGAEVCKWSLTTGTYVFGSPSTILIRADLVREQGLRYNTANLHADEEFCYEALRSSDFGFIHELLVYFRQHEESETAKVSEYHSIFMGRLRALLKFGPDYLDPSEFARRRTELMRDYRRLLAVSFLRGKRREFWRYHRELQKELGIEVPIGGIVASGVGAIAERVLNPLDTLRMLKGQGH